MGFLYKRAVVIACRRDRYAKMRELNQEAQARQ